MRVAGHAWRIATKCPMRISLITVSYNSSDTIAETLQSAARQSGVDVEHIVVDGASMDGTTALVRAHGAHVAAFVCEPDLGIYDAMNKGLGLATGDIVGFLNADDVYQDENVLADVAAAFAAGADVVYGDLVYVDRDDIERTRRYWRAGRFRRRSLRFGWMPPHPTLYLSRQLVQRIGRFDRTMRIAADYDYMLRCLTQDGIRVRYVPRVMVRMRLGGASNGSLKALTRKFGEDFRALRRSGIGGAATVLCKTLRKLPQLLQRPSAEVGRRISEAC